MSVQAQTMAPAFGLTFQTPWLYSRRWDLTFIIGSAAVVAVPLLLFYQAGLSSSIVNMVVAAVVGGPHMYSTYTFTMLEPRFWRRYPLYALGAFAVPVGVVTLALVDLTLLITVFMFWAALHVMQQVAWLADCYRAKGGESLRSWSRASDYALLFTSLYPFASIALVSDAFVIEGRIIQVPAFLKADWVASLAWTLFIIAAASWIAKTASEARTGSLNLPRTMLVGLAAAIAFVIPTFDNMDVAFQGMNTWHSLQYLAIIWYFNRLRAENKEIGNVLVRGISGVGSGRGYYLALVGVTVGAGGLIVALNAGLGLPMEQAYWMVMLSFLLVHYYYDTFFFLQPRSLMQRGGR